MKKVLLISSVVFLIFNSIESMGDCEIMKKTIFLKNFNTGDSVYLYKQITLGQGGLITEEITFNAEGEVNSIITYSYEGKKLDKETYKTGDKNVALVKKYSYDNNGKLEKIISEGLSFNVLEYEFFKNGQYDETTFLGENKQLQRHFSADGYLLWEFKFKNGFRTDYQYDNLWNILEIKEEHKEGHTIIRHQTEYDDFNNLSKVFINNILSSSFSYKNDLLEKEVQYDLNGQPIFEMTYEYEF